MDNDEDLEVTEATAEDLYEASLGDLIQAAEDADTDSMCLNGKDKDGNMHWGVIIVRGSCAEELFESLTHTLEILAERINKRNEHGPS